MDYLNKVLTYLKQELPNREISISLTSEKFIITVPAGKSFNTTYEQVQQDITNCVQRIRNREQPLQFTIKTPTCERDFVL